MSDPVTPSALPPLTEEELADWLNRANWYAEYHALSRCDTPAPASFTGHWRDWHRGHGCEAEYRGFKGNPVSDFELAGLTARNLPRLASDLRRAREERDEAVRLLTEKANETTHSEEGTDLDPGNSGDTYSYGWDDGGIGFARATLAALRGKKPDHCGCGEEAAPFPAREFDRNGTTHRVGAPCFVAALRGEKP